MSQPVPSAPSDAAGDRGDAQTISDPAELIRIAGMVTALLGEVREITLDEPGRRRLADAYRRSISEVRSLLSDDLRDELDDVAPPLEGEPPSESELQIAQAQLAGWLDGLVRGIQATVLTQQRSAQQQLARLAHDRQSGQGPEPGQYL